MGVLSAGTSVHHVHVCGQQRPKEDVGPPGPELQIVVSRRVSLWALSLSPAEEQPVGECGAGGDEG